MEKAEAPVHMCIPWLWPHITPTSASIIKSASLPPLPCKDPCDYIRPTQIIQDNLPSQNSQFNEAGTFCQVRSRNHRFCGLGLGQIWGSLFCPLHLGKPLFLSGLIFSPANCESLAKRSPGSLCGGQVLLLSFYRQVNCSRKRVSDLPKVKNWI